ncbi:hypothetical protein ACEPAI_3274 [Sanghuangporus weigelae]
MLAFSSSTPHPQAGASFITAAAAAASSLSIYHPSSSVFTSSPCVNRARGPSFASTTSHTSVSTATSSTSSASSSGAPATPPRTDHPLAYVSSPTTSSVLRPYRERSRPLRAGDEDECRLDEEAEDQLRDREKELHGPRAIADHNEDDAVDSTDEEYEHDARRNWRKMTDSPRSVARSVSLSHGQGRASPNSPIMMNSLSGASSRPQSPALSVHSHIQSAVHSPAHSSSPVNLNSPSPAHTGLPLRDSHTPSLSLPEASPEVDASRRTALLLNPDPDLTLARTFQDSPTGDSQADAARDRVSVVVVGSGTVEDRACTAWEADRAEPQWVRIWSFSSTSRPHPYARVSSPLASSEKRVSGGRRSSSQPYTYAYGFWGECALSDSRYEYLISERPSSSQLTTPITAVGGNTKSKSNSNDNDNDKGKVEEGEGGDDVPTCFTFKWSLRARWAALKLRVRLGAFRARRRVGLV